MEEMFEIGSFSSGLNEYVTEALMNPSEAVIAKNCDIGTGSLKTINSPTTIKTVGGTVQSLVPYYSTSNSYLYTVGNVLYNEAGTSLKTLNNGKIDSINFEYNGKKVLVGTSYNDGAFLVDGTTSRNLKNRRISYNEAGEIDGYIDSNGVKKKTEAEITTYAPSGSFIELHYDRVWIAGHPTNKDRLYFSTAGVNGADIEDFTIPIEEEEANQHGGFIDVRSYDGGEIIGLKVVFNALVIFKNKSAYKVFGDNPENYELVQLFSSNGAISDKSICTGDNGAYFLNNDGIYFYDGTNTNLISQKVNKTIANMNKSYVKASCGCFYDNKYYLAIPTGTSTTNNCLIVYNALTKSFVIHELGGFGNLLEHNGKLYGSIGANIVELYQSSGTNQPLKWETPNYDFGKLNSRKNSNYIYFRGKGNGSVRFTVITDRKTKVIDVPLTSTETLYKKKLKNKGKIFKITIENPNNSEIEITRPSLSTEIDLD